MDEMDEVIGEFLVESYENLDRLDQDLVALEDTPADAQLLGGIFRTIHTIKGTCGFLGYSQLEAIAHAGENLLSRMRDGELTLSPAITTALLAMVDAIRQILSSIEATHTEGERDDSALVATLHALLEGEEAPAVEPVAKPKKKSTKKAKAEKVEEAPVVEAAPVAEAPAPAPAAAAAAPVPAAAPVSGGAEAHVDSTLRVDVSLLDSLMNLVGELVLARNQLVQITGSQKEARDLTAATQRLNMITSELQEGVMKTRMQPIGSVLSKFPRVVRDIAVAVNKQVKIELEGKETELDKTINEAIKDPLTHLVRNSVDHGIESPEARIAAGKNPEGKITLRAFHEGGQVNIEIVDDGAGIDPEKIKAKAVEKGLVSPADAAAMTDREALQLIFLPGFSTAAAVSNISGRGVGMDVVKTNIENIGGTVDVATKPGEGTTFKIRIPLTLAIIPALLIGAKSATSGEMNRYAIPQVSLVELIRLEGATARQSIEMIHGAPVYRLRGKLLPIAHLGHELSGNEVEPWQGPSGDERVVNIVVLHADGRQFGLVVDDIRDTQEIVVKPLDAQLKEISAFAGATIMGDGRLALILDVMGLAHKASVISESTEKALAEANGDDEQSSVEDAEAFLLLQIGDRRAAVPLSDVARLEEFPMSIVEQANGSGVVQYRGEIMPLIDMAYALNVHPADRDEDDDKLDVVVFSSGGRSVGLLVDDILDIAVDAIRSAETAGSGNSVITSSAVIGGKVTDIVDVWELVRSMNPGFFADTELVGA